MLTPNLCSIYAWFISSHNHDLYFIMITTQYKNSVKYICRKIRAVTSLIELKNDIRDACSTADIIDCLLIFEYCSVCSDWIPVGFRGNSLVKLIPMQSPAKVFSECKILNVNMLQNNPDLHFKTIAFLYQYIDFRYTKPKFDMIIPSAWHPICGLFWQTKHWQNIDKVDKMILNPTNMTFTLNIALWLIYAPCFWRPP